MKIKPLTQLGEMIAAALSSQTNLSKSFQTFFIETMELMLTHIGRLNFTQMARCGLSCESRFRQNFKKAFDWLSFNKTFLEPTKGDRCAIAIDPCYISKSGKVDLKDLDMSVFSESYTVDGKLVYRMCSAVVWAVSLGREVRVVMVDYEDTDRKRQTRKVFFSTDTSMSAGDIFDIYRTRFQLEFVFRDAKQFTGLTHCQARNREALSFAFNASLSSVNLARAFAKKQGLNLSVGSTKTLLHNAAMVDRFIAMSGKTPNMRLNDTYFKELLFYGVRTVA